MQAVTEACMEGGYPRENLSSFMPKLLTLVLLSSYQSECGPWFTERSRFFKGKISVNHLIILYYVTLHGGKIPSKREWQPTLVFLLGEFQRQRSLMGYSPWDHKELDMTEQLTLSLRDFREQTHGCPWRSKVLWYEVPVRRATCQRAEDSLGVQRASVLQPQGTEFCQKTWELRRRYQVLERNAAPPAFLLQSCNLD